MLLEGGADPNRQNQDGATPLARAVYSWRASQELVDLLREYGADPYVADRIGVTPRQWAATSADADLMADLPSVAPVGNHPSLRDSDPVGLGQLEAVVSAIRAVVERDLVALQSMGADEALYEWTRNYGPWPEVTLRMPFGHPRSWWLGGMLYPDGNGCSVAAYMWTREEGPSDLVLQLEVAGPPDGPCSVAVSGLRVE